jgi:hypothetical protein
MDKRVKGNLKYHLISGGDLLGQRREWGGKKQLFRRIYFNISRIGEIIYGI